MTALANELGMSCGGACRTCCVLAIACLLGVGKAVPQARRFEQLVTADGVVLQFPPTGVWRQRAAEVAATREILYRSGRLPSLNAAAAAGVPSPSRAAVTGTLRLPSILLAYSNSDTAGLPTREGYDAVLYGAVAPLGRPYSLRTFYEELSNGVFGIAGSTYGWLQADSARDYYGTACSEYFASLDCSRGRIRLHEALSQVLTQLDDSVDFGIYDNDGPDGIPDSGDDDGVVDVVQFLHPEIGPECGGNGYWAHTSSLTALAGSAYVTDDMANGGGSIRIDPYSMASALGGASCWEISEAMPIGIAAHELGHGLGLPDLYDTDPTDQDDSEGIGEWGLMGAASYVSLLSPGHLSAWSKERLGWVVVRRVADAGTYSIGPVVTADTVLRIDPSTYNPRGEYFLLENRQPVGADTANMARGPLDAAKLGGLVVWHIDSARISQAEHLNRVNTGTVHGVRVVQAHTEQHAIMHNRGDGGDPFPGMFSRQSFTGLTVPAPLLNDNRRHAGFVMDSIRQVVPNGEMAFRYATGGFTVVKASDERGQIAVDGKAYTRFEEILFDGSLHTISVEWFQQAYGANLFFESWSDGGDRVHDIVGSSAGDSIVAQLSVKYTIYGEPSYRGGTGDLELHDAAGNVYRSPARAYIAAGEEVTLIALPEPGSVFGGWTEPFEWAGDTLTWVVTRSQYVEGTFTDSLKIVTDSLATGFFGVPYSFRLAATGGRGDLVWSMAGTIPGLSLASDGTLEGTPQQVGDFDLTVTVQRRTQSRTRNYRATVTIVAVDIDSVIDALLEVSGDLSGEVRSYLDFVGNRNRMLDVGDFYLYVTRERQTLAVPERAPPAPDSTALRPTQTERERW